MSVASYSPPISLDLVVHTYVQAHCSLYFMQIGAFDGVSADPIYPLVKKYGLHGVLIEPQRDAFEKLRANYRTLFNMHLTFIQAAVGPREGIFTLYRIKPVAGAPNWLHGIATFHKDVLMWHSPSIPHFESLIELEAVRCLTFEKIFASLERNRVDLLQIDAEGSDGQLLLLFDLETRKPAIVHFEHKHLSSEVYSACIAELMRLGYEIAVGSEDTLACSSELSKQVGLKTLPFAR